MRDRNSRFAGKVAVVTGGSSGIGAAIVDALQAEGARVMIGDLSDATSLPSQDVVARRTDVTDPVAFADLIVQAERELGPLDLLFNVAGGGRAGSILDLTPEDWDFCLRLSLTSAFLGTQLAARSFRAQDKAGAIVNVASINATVPMRGGVGYSVAKAGASMVTRQAALELAEFGIRVNTVSPGLVDTPMAASIIDTPEIARAFLDRIPLGRPADPREIASAALFLASDEASYITGSNLVVDAGWTTTGYPDLRALAKA